MRPLYIALCAVAVASAGPALAQISISSSGQGANPGNPNSNSSYGPLVTSSGNSATVAARTDDGGPLSGANPYVTVGNAPAETGQTKVGANAFTTSGSGTGAQVQANGADQSTYRNVVVKGTP